MLQPEHRMGPMNVNPQHRPFFSSVSVFVTTKSDLLLAKVEGMTYFCSLEPFYCIIMRKQFLLFSLLLFVCSSLSAQYTIFPTPQQMTVGTNAVTLSPTISIVCDPASDGPIDEATLARAEEVLTRNGFACRRNEAPADGCTALILCVSSRMNEERVGRYDHHGISVEKGAIRVTGQHTNAVFFGLATVEQLLEQRQGQTLRAVAINDWADQPMRGIVEGYYGYPYTIATRIDLMEWGKRYKMNTFIYGPKGDPFHLGAWRDNYPTAISAEEARNGMVTQDNLRQLAEASARTKVDFVWAAHPAFSNPIDLSTDEGTAAGAEQLLTKFDHLHQLGVRRFGIFLDDISVANGVRDCERHAALLRTVQDALVDRYNKDYVNAADTVRPLFFVPTPYALNFAKPDELTTYFRAIATTPFEITVFFTGSGVWSNISEKDYRTMCGYLGRPVAMWWNFPCNDNNDRNIYLMDVDSYYRTDPELQNSLGIVCNPMAQGEASKVSLFGVMDYCWNVRAFHSKQTWEHAFAASIRQPSQAEAYRFLAPWLMAKEPDVMGTLIDAFKAAPSEANASALDAQLQELQEACRTLGQLRVSSQLSDVLLWGEIHFWVEKLEDMCVLTSRLIKAYSQQGEKPRGKAARTQRKAELEALSSDWQAFSTSDRYTVVQKEGAGTSTNTSSGTVTPANRYLWPFMGWLKTQLFPEEEPGKRVAATAQSTRQEFYHGTLDALTDGDPSTYLWTNGPQQADDSFTFTLPRKTRIRHIRTVLMAADRMKEATLETSLDGINWTPVGTVTDSELTPVAGYDAFVADTPCARHKARFVRFRITKPNEGKWFKMADLNIYE